MVDHNRGVRYHAPRPIPLTVLTGFLGAGMTTLLSRILTSNRGLRVLVVASVSAARVWGGTNVEA